MGIVDEKLKLLPDSPGCYLFRDAGGTILYIGKAVSLKNRVRSYFQAGRGLEGKVQALVAQVADVEHIVTDSEVEALILESNLIKEHRPKYNVRLRDDKHYPYLRIDPAAAWPRLEMVRRVRADRARYFGPFPSTPIGETLQLLRRVFPYRSCSDRRLAQPHACLYHHIHRCLAPCIGACDEAQYRAMVAELTQFLEGRGEDVLRRVEARMQAAADELRFEQAAELRDQLTALRGVIEKQKISSSRPSDRDVIAMARGRDEAAVQVFFVREGKVAGRDAFMLSGSDGRPDAEVLAAFVKQYYSGGPLPPREIVLGAALEAGEAAAIRAWLRRQRGAAVDLVAPRRGERRKLIELVEKNAAEYLAEEQWRRERSRDALERGLAELQAALSLPGPPRRIECFDISNTQGQLSVGAMAVFEDGAPKKSDYRRFRIKTVEGADDFASLREVVGRRFRRARGERRAAAGPDGELEASAAGFARLPDLVIIDGGPGQLGYARQALAELDLEWIPTFALAKQNEWLFAPGASQPIVLDHRSPALHLLQRLRDETHRFAVTYHRGLRGRAGLASLLEEVPGIGARRRKALLSAYRSLDDLRAASPDDLARVPGMSRTVAEELALYLQSV